MRRTALISALLFISSCAAHVGDLPRQTKDERRAQVHAANLALKVGNHEQAEKLLADYMYRDADGELRFKAVSLTSQGRKEAIDTVTMLLWETGRDASLEGFATRYLNGYEKDVMLCRLAERNALYEQSYHCWNDLGDIDRARRSVRTESAIRILRD